MIPFLRRELIKTTRDRGQSPLREADRGDPVTYPLNVEDFFYVLFGLETVYDTDGRLNNFGEGHHRLFIPGRAAIAVWRQG